MKIIQIVVNPGGHTYALGEDGNIYYFDRTTYPAEWVSLPPLPDKP